MNRFLSNVVAWLREGYPAGVPQNDYLPILALLSRRLSNDEVIAVARQFLHLARPGFVDIGAEILRITDQLPAPADVDRVRAKLAAHGWPLDDPRDEAPHDEAPHDEAPPRRGRGGRITTLRALTIPAGPSALSVMAALDGVLDGRDAPLVPVPAGSLRESELLTSALRVGEEIDDDVALVVATSGTTGTPKGAMLTAAALIAGATATHDRLGGPGTWLLALPSHHIAGIQVLVRSLQAGTVPVEMDLCGGFDVTELPSAVKELGSGRRYTSLVSNQLAKALADPAAAAALADLDAVLLGGGPAPRPVLDGAAEAGITVVRTYGSSETAGGCVYDGLPLEGVSVRIDDPAPDGRGCIVIGGHTLAKGYRNPPDPDPFAEPGWFRTDDIGALDESGRLTVLGRSDDAISTGGLTVLPGPVEAALSRHPAVAECAVVGVDDDLLGQRVVAAVVLADGAAVPTLEEVRDVVGQMLDRTAAPRDVVVVDELPRRGIGKIDRAALRARVTNR